MSDQNQERSKSGAPIHRHAPRKIPFDVAIGDGEKIELISDHIEKHLGPIDNVWHELISDLVHVDVYVVNPTPARNFYTLVTSGLSEAPMSTPEGAEELAWAELCICLPPTWPLTQEDFKNESNYWPLRWLKILARFPHEYDTWISYGHTIPNGDPPEPYAPGTKLCCQLLVPPLLLPKDFLRLSVTPEKTIHFWQLLPLHADEVQFKLDHGLDALMDKFPEGLDWLVLNPRRRSVCRPWWKFWG